MATKITIIRPSNFLVRPALAALVARSAAMLAAPIVMVVLGLFLASAFSM